MDRTSRLAVLERLAEIEPAPGPADWEEAREIALDIDARIEALLPPDAVDRWFGRALVSASVDEVLAES